MFWQCWFYKFESFDINHASQTQKGRTALLHSALNGESDCVRLLVEAGADKEAKDSVRDVLCFDVQFSADYF